METKHTDACIQATEKYNREKEEYEKLYPNYCRTCRGWGVIEGGGDLVDYGSTQVHLPTYPEPCPACSDEGICPRCGKQDLVLDDTGMPNCVSCGFKADMDGLPYQPECWCWEKEMEQDMEDYEDYMANISDENVRSILDIPRKEDNNG